MQRTTVVIAFVASLGLAYATADWKTPPQHRVHTRGQRFAVQTPESGTEPGDVEPAAPAAGAVEPSQPTPQPDPEPKREPKPRAKIELKTITDVTLCVAENAQDPTFRRSCEIHLDMEGERTWHAGGKTVELATLKKLKSGLDNKFDIENVVWVPDQFTNWQAIRDVTFAAQKAGRGAFWIGVAKADEPTTLRMLSFRQEATDDLEQPGGDVFTIYVKEVEEKLHIEVNGKQLEDFPAGLALAWNEWKSAHPDADTSAPEKTPVVLDAHRWTPCQMVVNVLDVLRGLGIECQMLAGDLGQRRRR